MEEKLEDKLKCIICRKQIHGVQQPFRLKNSETIENWNEKCIETFFKMLFKTDSPNSLSIKKSLHVGGYCTKCRQRVWDLEFFDKMIQKLQNNISVITRQILEDIFNNYKHILTEEENDVESQYDFKPKRLPLDSDTNCDTVDFSRNYLLYDETVQLIYKELDSAEMFSSLKLGQNVKTTGLPLSSKIRIKHHRNPNNKDHSTLIRNVSSDISEEFTLIKAEVPDESGSDDNKNDDPHYIELFSSTESSDGSNYLIANNNINERLKIKTATTTATTPPSRKRKRVRRRSSFGNHKKYEVKCSEKNCTRLFLYESGMQTHIRKDHFGDPNPYHCPFCDRKFQHNSSLKAHHLATHNTTYKLQCSVCQMGFNDIGKLKVHEESRHRAKTYNHFCSVCSKGFDTVEKLEKHSSIHEGKFPFTCEDCCEKFQTRDKLVSHIQTLHQSSGRPVCVHCGKTFATLSYLKVHEKLFHTEISGKIHKCRKCGQEFQKLSVLRAHQRHEHSDGKNVLFQCTVCEKSLASKKGLVIHMRTHSGERPFECKLCKKAFKSKDHLNKHESMHSGIKNCICHICGHSCSCLENLRMHSKIHSKDYRPRKRKSNCPPIAFIPKPVYEDSTVDEHLQLQNEFSDRSAFITVDTDSIFY